MSTTTPQNLPSCTCCQLGVCNSCIAALCLDKDQQTRIDAWDANAFRLAARLNMSLAFYKDAPPELHIPRQSVVARLGEKWFAVPYLGDAAAAMRQAIAAAVAGAEIEAEAEAFGVRNE